MADPIELNPKLAMRKAEKQRQNPQRFQELVVPETSGTGDGKR